MKEVKQRISILKPLIVLDQARLDLPRWDNLQVQDRYFKARKRGKARLG
jgi:hypothetical protein